MGAPDIFYGMGWYIMPTNGVRTVRHVGVTGNFHANIVLVPEGRWGLVLLMNGNSAFLGHARIEGIAVGVTSLLVGLVTSDRLNVAALIALLALLAGAVLAGLLVAHAAAAAVLLPVALLAVVVAVSTVRRRELWVASGR